MNLGIESEHTEFKRSTSELKEGMVSLASILNKHGSGELYFGVTPCGDVCGQEVSETTLRQISQAIGMSIEPKIVPEITVLDDEGKQFIRVSFAGSDTPYSCKGAYRIRSADEDVVMTSSQIEAMIAQKIEARHPWDSRASQRSLADIDEKILREYVERGRSKGRIPFDFTDVEDVLSRLDLLSDGSPTNAADVLFCKSGDIRLKMGILETHARTRILDLHQEGGTVFELVDKGVAYVINNTRRAFVMDGLGPRKEIPEIPTLAVREALMNAFAHQDWTLRGSIQIDIFNDAVEMLSPGWFVEGQDPVEHLTGKSASSRSRNPLIAKTLYRSGDIESYGTGIPRMKALCDEAGVDIEYQRTPDGTKLIFHRNDAFAGELAESWEILAGSGEPGRPETTDADQEQPAIGQNRIEPAEIRLNPPEAAPIRRDPPKPAGIDQALSQLSANDRIVYEHMATKDSVTSRSLSTDLEMPIRTVRDVLRRLIVAQLVTSVGKGKSTEYRVV